MSEDPLLHAFHEFVRGARLIGRGDRILAAVSGGIDSMVLLDLLCRSVPVWNLSLAVAHFNHRLRGAESDGDEAHVRAEAAARGLACYVEGANTSSVAEARRQSVQEAARDLRYAFFDTLRISTGFSMVATAHQADDNAETVLFNLFRGAGVKGLSGIPVERSDHSVIRPLLFAGREAIAAYAERNGIAYRTDSSNARSDYARNFLRNELMPQIRARINPNLGGALHRTSELFDQLDRYIEEEAAKRTPEVIASQTHEELVLRLDAFHALQLFLQEHLLRRFVAGFTGAEPDFGAVKMLINVSHAAPGSGTTLGADVEVWKDRGLFTIRKARRAAPFRYVVRVGEEREFGRFSFAASAVERPPAFSGDPSVEYADAERLTGELLLRSWEEGDWFIPLGMTERKKVSDFFVDAKVPLFEKREIPILVAGTEIVWVCGRRLDERFKVTPATARVVRLTYTLHPHNA